MVVWVMVRNGVVVCGGMDGVVYHGLVDGVDGVSLDGAQCET